MWSPPVGDAAGVPALIDAVRTRLADIAARHQRVALASSLQAEDQLLTALIAREALPIDVFVLETGRLHAETLDLIAATEQALGLTILRISPDPAEVTALVARDGLHGFYDSVAARLACCGVRKVVPLRATLSGRGAWITGQRRAQAAGRAALAFEEHDDAHGLAKFNPLADWSLAQVWAAVSALGVPTNPLHAQGFPSIGCEPCTRAIRADEDVRAGRWWWEQSSTKECGLHLRPAATAA
jgi:phosphoadenosine phosphosulfate reductase